MPRKKKEPYFSLIMPIWNAFEKGKIGVGERERMLEPFRKQLAAESFKSLSKRAKKKGQSVDWLINQK